MRILLHPSILSLLSGLALAGASLFPETWVSLGCALLSAALLYLGVERTARPGINAFLAGVCFHLVAFYWVPQTVQVFGGFGYGGALLVFALFCVTASFQFLLLGFSYGYLRRRALAVSISLLPFLWMLFEYAIPRLFPWQIGHAWIVATPIAAAAEFFGVVPLSGLMLWWGVSVVEASRRPKHFVQRIAAVVVVSVVLSLAGHQRTLAIGTQLAKVSPLSVALVQGNLSTDVKGDSTFLTANVERYRALSQDAVKAGAQMVFWPESVVNQWLPASVIQLRNTKFDPDPQGSVPMLYGTLSYAKRTREEIAALQAQGRDRGEDYQYAKFNAAVGVDADGRVVGRYYKRVLMPFGEFLPFESRFPWLRQLSPQTGDFASGKLRDPINLSVADRELRAGVLICYEDLVPALSREAANAGANVLVNLTNDAWYGDTAAPLQHHLLAQWRALETRRYLLRVTNTGKTAIVDPFGRTSEEMPIFEEGYVLGSIKLLDVDTLYTRYGDLPLFVILVLLALMISRRTFSRSRMLAAKTP